MPASIVIVPAKSRSRSFGTEKSCTPIRSSRSAARSAICQLLSRPITRPAAVVTALCFRKSRLVGIAAPGLASAVHYRSCLAAGAQMLGKVVGKIAIEYRACGALNIILDPHKLHPRLVGADVEQYVARSPVAILRPADASRIHEVNAVHRAVPRLVGMTEADHIASGRPD